MLLMCNNISGCQAIAGLKYHPPRQWRGWFVANGSCGLTDGCQGLTNLHPSKNISLGYLVNNWVCRSIVRHLIVIKLAISKGPYAQLWRDSALWVSAPVSAPT